MSEGALDLGSRDKRRTLWIVLILNVAIAAGFFATGALGDSSALIANGLDNASDAVVYAISLIAIGRPPKWKRGAARFSGVMLLAFAVGVLIDAGRRFLTGSDPIGVMMMIMALVAAAVNLLSLFLLKRLRERTSASAPQPHSVSTTSSRTAASWWVAGWSCGLGKIG